MKKYTRPILKTYAYMAEDIIAVSGNAQKSSVQAVTDAVTDSPYNVSSDNIVVADWTDW